MVEKILDKFIDMLFIIIIALGAAAFAIFNSEMAHAGDFSIYDSPSYKDRVVVEYCDNNNKCDRLLLYKKELNSPEGQATITMWLDDRLDERKEKDL